MIHTILKMGDPRLLRSPGRYRVDTPALHTLVHDMFETMEHAQGVGLAAPQIGVMRRLAVVEASEGLVGGDVDGTIQVRS